MDGYVKKNKFNGCSLSIADIEGNTILDIASGHADKEKTKEFWFSAGKQQVCGLFT